jgi:hypothetical protein
MKLEMNDKKMTKDLKKLMDKNTPMVSNILLRSAKRH